MAQSEQRLMKLIDFEKALARMRELGATDDTVVLGIASQAMLGAFAEDADADEDSPKTKARYFTMRDVCYGERSPEHGGGMVIRCYHYTV